MANRGGCCVPKCNNSPKDGVSFHIFPKDVKLRKQWIANITKASKLKRWSPSASNLKVCSAHFEGGRKTSDNNIPTVFNTQKNNAKLEPVPRKMSARQLAKKAMEATAEKRSPTPPVEDKTTIEEKPMPQPVQVKKPPSPVPQPNMVKKPPGRAQPKKATAKAQRGKPTKKQQRIRSRSMSAKDEINIKQEEGFVATVMSPKVLQRLIREDHMYCLPKSDSVSILQKILEEKAKVIETLLERVQTLETRLEEKDWRLKQMQQELQRAQAQNVTV